MVAPPLPTYLATAQPRLATALADARHENRRVLIVWGANAETPSQDFILTMLRHGEVSRTLLYEYEVVRAEVKGNERLAAKYKVPKGRLPHLTVLDANGALLASEPVAPFKAAGDGRGGLGRDETQRAADDVQTHLRECRPRVHGRVGPGEEGGQDPLPLVQRPMVRVVP